MCGIELALPFGRCPLNHSGGGCTGHLPISRPRKAAVSLRVAGSDARLPLIVRTTKRESKTECGAVADSDGAGLA